MSTSIGIVAYLALFAGVGVVFLFVNLLVGRFVRPSDPTEEKLEIYECGEPPIGSSFVQFDLRFYVVALLFIIFDVEVAFFFPWAVVFGKTTHLMDEHYPPAHEIRAVDYFPAGHDGMQIPEGMATILVTNEDGSAQLELTPPARKLYQELGVRDPQVAEQIPISLSNEIEEGWDQSRKANAIAHRGARQLAFVTIVDIVVFFAVLLVGFAYVWKRGDLDWVRAHSRETAARGPGSVPRPPVDNTTISA
jgi:NADH-quinone oxidoreductase subunit A